MALYVQSYDKHVKLNVMPPYQVQTSFHVDAILFVIFHWYVSMRLIILHCIQYLIDKDNCLQRYGAGDMIECRNICVVINEKK